MQNRGCPHSNASEGLFHLIRSTSIKPSNLQASILGGRGVPQDEYWIWIGVAAMVFFNILFNITAWLCHAYLNRE